MSNPAWKFRSKTDALRSAVKVWGCKSCDTWHTPKNPTVCQYCGFDQFHYFASKFEAKRYAELSLLEKTGQITELRSQITYPLTVNSQPICKYIADFQYKDLAGNLVVEDTKGDEKAVTDSFKLKRKLMGAVHGINVKIVYQSPKKGKKR